jgi:hypothetical protein
MFSRIANTSRAHAANERGRGLADRGDDNGAEGEYRRAVELDPKFESAWFNLGLIYKRRLDWAKCATCNLRAAELSSQPSAPAWWNLGIAATAMRDWKLARRAWHSYGVVIPDGEGPIDGFFGRTPVRLRPIDSGEVVWCKRIDPARAIIENVPLPESGHRHGDIVLHDGAPHGERLVEGKAYSVFDELELWEASDEPTVVAALICPTTADSKAALDALEVGDVYAEDWTSTIRALCKACSEGRTHSSHDFAGGEGWRAARNVGCSGKETVVRDLLSHWVTEGSGRQIESIQRAL